MGRKNTWEFSMHGRQKYLGVLHTRLQTPTAMSLPGATNNALNLQGAFSLASTSTHLSTFGPHYCVGHGEEEF